ncbi:ABC transporter ATP-binding protein [Methanosphaera sp.]|uniref:ABC transporter ATP-binding protein n=1 Tax=Methanosphaera sp. TaxID=2666342 RepID=UPI0025DEA18A|nr:ABC transporter ATP-binding protein [Methanosphaera sp.]
MKNILKIMKDKVPLLVLMMLFLIIEVYCDLTLPSYTADIVNNGIQNTDFNLISSIGLNMMLMVTISVFATVIVSYISSKVSSSYARDLREKIFEKILNFSNHELNQFSKASLITRSTNDINQIQHVIGIMFRTLLFAPILAIGSIIRVFEIGSNLSWIIFVAFISVAILLVSVISTVLPYFKKTQEIVDQINRVSREILLGIPVIKAFVRQEYEKERFDFYNREYVRVNLKVYRTMFILIPSMNLIMNLMIVLILYFGSFDVLNGTLLTGDIIAFTQYSTQMVASFIMIGGFVIMLPRLFVSINRIEEVLSTEISITDGTVKDESLKDVIEFKNVSFTYPGAERKTLNNINFKLEPGKTTAIIGGTGSGKSTILNLIPRLQDVTSGEILLNNINIKEFNLKNLRNKISLAPQQAVLFSGTVRSNLRKGKNEANDTEMFEAIKNAQADEFIKDLESEVSQGGSNFSGGQKQRLSIARTIIGKHSFYLFDDCFSALDVSTEKKIREKLKEITEGSSVLLVSQRISTIKFADEIIVLDDGKIIDKGTHNELKERCSLYKEILSSQLENMGGSL